jgi:hypothetical protein
MDLYPTAETWSGTPGAIAPADGNASAGVTPASSPASLSNGDESRSRGVMGSVVGAQHAAPLLGSAEDVGPNNERLEDVKPELVNALRELVRQYRQEGIVARRHEIRRIRQARLFWKGLQYAWWSPNDMNWHLTFEQRFSDDRALEEMPRYQFVTNFYQGFGLSFCRDRRRNARSRRRWRHRQGLSGEGFAILRRRHRDPQLLHHPLFSGARRRAIAQSRRAQKTVQLSHAVRRRGRELVADQLHRFPDSPSAPQTQQPLPLSSPALKDLELPINVLGERVAFQVSTNQSGAWFRLQKFTPAVRVDPWALVRGLN